MAALHTGELIPLVYGSQLAPFRIYNCLIVPYHCHNIYTQNLSVHLHASVLLIGNIQACALIYLLKQQLVTNMLIFPQDVEEKVEKTFPNAINKWAIQEARSMLEKGKKKSVVLPVEKVHNLLVKVIA